MPADPRTEHPDATRARALASLDAALALQPGITPADKVMLRDLMLPAWQEWVAAMQTARMDQIAPHHVRVAMLFLLSNVFWETVVMTTKPVNVAPIGERLLQQLIGIIRQGPGR